MIERSPRILTVPGRVPWSGERTDQVALGDADLGRRAGRGRRFAVAAGLAFVLVQMGAGGAVAEGGGDGSGAGGARGGGGVVREEPTRVGAPAAGAPRAALTPAAVIAQGLRDEPVYVSDQMPRAIPRSSAPDYARLAERTGVPTYVVALPHQGEAGAALLDAVHRELERDGLYVLLDDTGVQEATAFGVGAPVRDARTVAVYELPSDAGPLLSFERFTEALALGPQKAAERAEAAVRGYSDAGEAGPEPLYITDEDRRDQTYLTGVLLSGLPALILLLGPYARRWWARDRRGPSEGGPAGSASASPVGAAAPGKKADLAKGAETSTSRKGQGQRRKGGSKKADPAEPDLPRFRPNLWEVATAAVVAAVVGFGAPMVFDETKSGAAPPPTVDDLRYRIERVASGVREDPLYTDPESRQHLDAKERAGLRERIARLSAHTGGPVYVAVVPSLFVDETAGQAPTFMLALRGELKAEGAGLFITADPVSGELDAVNFGPKLVDDALSSPVPDDIWYPEPNDDGTRDSDSDPRLGERLDELLTSLQKLPAPGTPSDGQDDELGSGIDEDAYEPEPAPDPVEEITLPSLYSEGFVPTLIMGVIYALGLHVVIISVLGIIAGRRRRAAAVGEGNGASGGMQGSGRKRIESFQAPAHPTLAYLRKASRKELSALRRELEAEDRKPDAELSAWARDCLNSAAGLLATAEGMEAGQGTGAAEGTGAAGTTEGTGLARPEAGRPEANRPGVAASTLAAAVVLARCARAALRTGVDEIPEFACRFNPLHGPATVKEPVEFPGSYGRQALPLCRPCHRSVTHHPERVDTLKLKLPRPAGAASSSSGGGRDGAAPRPDRVLYLEAPGPLASVRHGIARLMREVQAVR